MLEDNKAVKEAVKAYNLAKPEFLQIPAADGKTMLNAWIMKPVNQEAGKKYPLLITQYSGPNSQQVKNNWSLSWLNYLAQEGISLPVSTRVVRQLARRVPEMYVHATR